MLLQNGEALVLEVAAVAVLGAILLGVADTPAYPLVLCMEIVALGVVLTDATLTTFKPVGLIAWLNNPTAILGGNS